MRMLQDVRRRAGLSFSYGDRALTETTRVLAVDRATSGRHRHPCCFREYAVTPPVCATYCRLDGIRSLSPLYSKSGLICRLHAESLNVMKQWKRIVASWCSRMMGLGRSQRKRDAETSGVRGILMTPRLSICAGRNVRRLVTRSAGGVQRGRGRPFCLRIYRHGVVNLEMWNYLR